MNKISLKGLKEVLSDKELKEVMAGSGGVYCSSQECTNHAPCPGGHCSITLGGGCACVMNP